MKMERMVYKLVFAKYASLNLLKKLYYAKDVKCLSRKKLKINKSLGIIHDAFGRDAGIGRQAALRRQCL